MGNITQIKDAVLPDVFFDNRIISADQLYTYDALYRLVKAEGREQQGLADFGGQDNYDDSAWQSGHKGNGDITHRYIQHYLYDAVGNIMQLRHCVPSNTAYSYTRNYGYDSNSNRLDSTEVTGAVTTPYAYVHDTRGNMTELPHLDDIYWNVRNELHKIEQGTMAAYYQYSGGQRIRKYVVKGSIAEERIYLGSFKLYRKFDSGSLTIERHTVHISDDTGRIAMLEKRTVGDRLDDHDTEEVLVRYIYSNHLQSASLELDEYAAIISYEEYHPYGTTSFQSNDVTVHANAKRYRYTGKERDEESGLYYHGARYYIPWLCRWSAVDPINSEWYNMLKGNPGRNLERDFTELTACPYEYCYDNPVRFNDPTGEQPPARTLPVRVPLQRGTTPIRDNGNPLAPTDIGIGVRYAEAAAHDYTGAGSNSMAIERLKQLFRREPELPPQPTPEQREAAMQKFSQNERSQSGLFVNKAAEDAYWKSKEPQNAAPIEKHTTDISTLTDQDKKDITQRVTSGDASDQDRIYLGQMIGHELMLTRFKSKDPLVTDLAVFLETLMPGIIKEVEKKIIDSKSGKIITDFDIVTTRGLIIEVTVGSGKGKVEQIQDRQIPYAGEQEVVLFGPNVGGAVEKNLKANNIKLFRKKEELVNYINTKGQ